MGSPPAPQPPRGAGQAGWSLHPDTWLPQPQPHSTLCPLHASVASTKCPIFQQITDCLVLGLFFFFSRVGRGVFFLNLPSPFLSPAQNRFVCNSSNIQRLA